MSGIFRQHEHYAGEKNAFGAFAADLTSKPFDKSLHASPERKLQGLPNIITMKACSGGLHHKAI